MNTEITTSWPETTATVLPVAYLSRKFLKMDMLIKHSKRINTRAEILYNCNKDIMLRGRAAIVECEKILPNVIILMYLHNHFTAKYCLQTYSIFFLIVLFLIITILIFFLINRLLCKTKKLIYRPILSSDKFCTLIQSHLFIARYCDIKKQ
jgi:hypothetical protein